MSTVCLNLQKEGTGAAAGRNRRKHQPDSRRAKAAMVLYQCPSCGAEIVTEETTAATFCYYCHNPVVISGKLEGRYRPDYVVPFEMDRNKAEEIFKSWIRRKKYVPKDFYSPKQIEMMEEFIIPTGYTAVRWTAGLMPRVSAAGQQEQGHGISGNQQVSG